MSNQWMYPPLPNSPDEQIWSSPKTTCKYWKPLPIKPPPKHRKVVIKDESTKIYTEFEKQVAIDNVNYYRKIFQSIIIQKNNFLSYYGLKTKECLEAYIKIELQYIEIEKKRREAEFYFCKTVGVVKPNVTSWEEYRKERNNF